MNDIFITYGHQGPVGPAGPESKKSLPKLVYDPSIDIPAEIIGAAIQIERYFKEQGIKEWKLLGIESRKFEIERDLMESLAGFVLHKK